MSSWRQPACGRLKPNLGRGNNAARVAAVTGAWRQVFVCVCVWVWVWVWVCVCVQMSRVCVWDARGVKDGH